MQHLEVSGEVRPIYMSLGGYRLIGCNYSLIFTVITEEQMSSVIQKLDITMP